MYRAKLADATEGFADLCVRLGLTGAQAREVLDRLVDLDLLRPSRDTPGTLRAVSTELGLALLLRRQGEDLARRHEELTRPKAAAGQGISEFAELQPNPEVDDTGRLVGMDAIQNRLEGLAHGSTKECLAILPGGALSQASLEASRALDRQAQRPQRSRDPRLRPLADRTGRSRAHQPGAALVVRQSPAGVNPDDRADLTTCRFCSRLWDTEELASYFNEPDEKEPTARQPGWS
ncbi:MULTISPECIES: hypothetical protein [unclassified Streptomyces]|uniref:hypothetical protein n=1 Tax=unclassified Streptomyces TaxID=2593676 RepID=UPI002E28DBFC|nr:hypothetical protein [Streptomyces sp. NBC_00273]